MTTTATPSITAIPALPALPRKMMHVRQCGSVAVIVAVVISTLVILLAAVDIGFLFLQKRELQKIADLSALAGAQQLSRSSAEDQCASAYRVATDSARIAHDFPDTPVVTCGRWLAASAESEPQFVVYPNGIPPNGNSPATAVRVQLSRSFPSFFGSWSDQSVGASAIANAAAPNAVFSVGSRLLRIEDGVVPGLLQGLGVNISGTSLVSYNGLANVIVKPSGLLNALGFQIPLNAEVATIKELLLTNTSGCSNGVCTLEALLGAMSIAGAQPNLVSALGLQISQLDLPIKLLTDASGRGLFVLLDAADGQSALSADINALELLTTMIGVANSHRFADVTTSINIPGVVDSQIKVGLVEPPSIGIGGVGTVAYTSQVRLFSHVESNLLNAGLLKVNVPLAIDVVNGKGTITAMCGAKDSQGRDTATIAVDVPILKACAGNMHANSIFATNVACDNNLQNIEVVDFLNGTLRLSTAFTIDALNSTGSVTLSKGQTATIGNNNLPIGTTVSNVMQTVLASLLGKLLSQGQGAITDNNLAAGLLSSTNNSLNSSVQLLNNSLGSLKIFVNSLNSDIKAMLGGSLTSGVINLLAGVGNLVGGLLNRVGNLLENLLGNLACLGLNYNQCMLEKELSGNQGSGANSVSNVLLSVVAMLEKLLEPTLNSLGSQIATLLTDLFGLKLGQVDVTLIDLDCGGGSNVKLVY